MQSYIDGEYFNELINGLDVCFISSVDSAGFPNTKAMLPPRKREGLHSIWFSTNTSSMRVSQFRANPKACVYFCNRRSFQGLMLLGTVVVLENAEIKEALWRDGDEQYYSLGVTDPDYCVLRFTGRNGRYYNGRQTAAFDIKPPEYSA